MCRKSNFYRTPVRSAKIKVVPAAFQWSDLGSFEAVYDYLVSKKYPIDADGNMVLGTELHTTFVGLKNTIFVHTPTANLIVQKEASQHVKKVYEKLEEEDSTLVN